ITLEQVDHRQVARPLAIGDGRGLKDLPALHPVRVGEFVNQTRLADARFAHHCRDLATPSADKLVRSPKLLDFAVAANELRRPTAGRRMEASPCLTCSRELK